MRPVRSTVLTIVLRVALLVALAVSMSLLVDYTSTEVPFCSSSGCLGLRFKYGRLGGLVPIPGLGVVAFTAVLVLSLARRVPGLETMSHSLAATGGVLALGLIAMQLIVGMVCVPCMVTDTAAVIAGTAGAFLLFDRAHRRRQIVKADAPRPPEPEEPLRTWTWVALGVLATLVPVLWPIAKPRPPVPAAILASYEDGKINVVEFSDFECPHCRDLHPRLAALVEEYGERVNYLRMHTPLGSHDRARPAARAAVCADEQGEGDAMAHELFQAESLADSDLKRIALVLGLDMEAYAACLHDPTTETRIDAEIAALEATGMVVTPSVYVGGQLIRGAKSDLVFRDAFSRAERGDDNWGVPGPLYFAVSGLALLLVVWLGRRRRDPAGPTPTGG